MARHQGLAWAKVQARLESRVGGTDKLWSLHEMERTGGEPDVVGVKTGEVTFFDCSEQSPKGRTSFCYDREALDSRKEHKPKNSVMDMAAAMGIELDCHAGGNPETRRRNLRRSALRPGLHRSQRCGVLLQRPGLPWLAQRLTVSADRVSRPPGIP